jgi:hypothetical protein
VLSAGYGGFVIGGLVVGRRVARVAATATAPAPTPSEAIS